MNSTNNKGESNIIFQIETYPMKNWKEEFTEKGSDLEHERWYKWQKYLHSLCVKNEDGTLTIPKERVERWERQIATSYSELSEQEKEYDRVEVRKYLPMVESLLEKQKKELMESIKKNFESQCSLTVDSRCKYWLRDDDDYEFDANDKFFPQQVLDKLLKNHD